MPCSQAISILAWLTGILLRILIRLSILGSEIPANMIAMPVTLIRVTLYPIIIADGAA